jgi:hypothetical protein
MIRETLNRQCFAAQAGHVSPMTFDTVSQLVQKTADFSGINARSKMLAIYLSEQIQTTPNSITSKCSHLTKHLIKSYQYT